VPLFVQRALAEGSIGVNGKKVLFIFLRGANDGINSVIPIQDSAYATARPTIGIDKDPAVLYDAVTGRADVQAAGYTHGINLGNGFAALHPALYNLSSVYNDGDLALVHRVAYRGQSRSHFDSQNYWENGAPNNNALKEGIFYRAMYEAMQASPQVASSALTAVSVQPTMPLIIRGQVPMTNLTSIGRYNLLGVYSTDRAKHMAAIDAANETVHPIKDNRDLIYGLGNKFKDTLDIFQDPTSPFFQNNYFDPANPAAPLFHRATVFIRISKRPRRSWRILRPLSPARSSMDLIRIPRKARLRERRLICSSGWAGGSMRCNNISKRIVPPSIGAMWWW